MEKDDVLGADIEVTLNVESLIEWWEGKGLEPESVAGDVGEDPDWARTWQLPDGRVMIDYMLKWQYGVALCNIDPIDIADWLEDRKAQSKREERSKKTA